MYRPNNMNIPSLRLYRPQLLLIANLQIPKLNYQYNTFFRENSQLSDCKLIIFVFLLSRTGQISVFTVIDMYSGNVPVLPTMVLPYLITACGLIEWLMAHHGYTHNSSLLTKKALQREKICNNRLLPIKLTGLTVVSSKRSWSDQKV